MDKTPPPSVSDAAAMLEQLTVKDVLDRIDSLDAESRALRTLLRTLRARESAPRRRQKEAAAC